MASKVAMAIRRNLAFRRLGELTGRRLNGQGSQALGVEGEALLLECLVDGFERVLEAQREMSERLERLESRRKVKSQDVEVPAETLPALQNAA